MPQRRQQDPRRTGQLAQYHPGGGDLRSRGRSQGPLTGDPSVTAPTEQIAPAQESPLFAGGPGEPPPQLARLERSGGVADTPLAGEGLMAPGFGGDTDMQARPAPTEGGGPTSVRSDPGLQAPIPPPIPEPIPDRADPDRRFHRFPGRQAGPPRHPENVVEVDYVPGYGPAPEPPGPPSPPWMPEGAAPPPREVSNGSRWRPAPPPPPPGPPRPQGPRIDWMPGDPGYDPDEGRGLRPPGDPGRRQQRDTEFIDDFLEGRERERMLSDIAGRGRDRGQQHDPWSESLANRGRDRGQQRERDMQRAQRRDARRARPLRA